MRTLECQLTTGRTVVLRELTGKEELAAAEEASDLDRVSHSMLLQWNQILRSLMSIDGVKFDPSQHTAETLRDLFSAPEWQLVCEGFSMLHRPSFEEVESFRKTAKFRAMETAAAPEDHRTPSS